jgi:hypothetical protein
VVVAEEVVAAEAEQVEFVLALQLFQQDHIMQLLAQEVVTVLEVHLHLIL